VGVTHHYLGDFEIARQYTTRALQMWRSSGVRFSFQEVDAQSVGCLSHHAILQWHFGEIPSCRATIVEAISLAKELNDMHGLAVALSYAGRIAYYERNFTEVDRLASDLIELSTRHSFAHWLAIGEVFRGWVRSALGGTAEGLSWIEDGIDDYRATGSIAWMAYFLTLKAEALHLADRTSDALKAITKAETIVEQSGGRYMSAELHRLRGVFLTATGADKTQIEASFSEAISIAKQQKSVSLAKRAEASYAEYRQKRERIKGAL
jgi:predicted ATPase